MICTPVETLTYTADILLNWTLLLSWKHILRALVATNRRDQGCTTTWNKLVGQGKCIATASSPSQRLENVFETIFV